VPELRHALVVLALSALAACTRTYYKEFAVDPQERSYPVHAQFEDIKGYLVSRGLRVLFESDGFIAVELDTAAGASGRTAPSDSLHVRRTADRVELTLVRRSSGADFQAGQLKTFQDTLEGRLRERTGHAVSLRLVEQRVSPLSNVQFQ
jgi:hypothetical protein